MKTKEITKEYIAFKIVQYKMFVRKKIPNSIEEFNNIVQCYAELYTKEELLKMVDELKIFIE